MKHAIRKHVWVISDGKECASLRVPMGVKMVNLPLVLVTRADA